MSDDIFIGQIVAWASTVIPENWVLCDGSTYGSVTTPDLRDRFIYGKYNDVDTPVTSGCQTHSHVGGASSSVSSHDHTYSGETDGAGGNSLVCSPSKFSAGGHTHSFSGTTGSDGAHSHGTTLSSATALPTYLKLYYIMKVA